LIVIEPITLSNISAFKEVRLRALQDSPSAFGSTYARECQFTDADWIQRVNNWNGERGIGLLAIEGCIPCGIAGSLLDPMPPDQEQPPRAQLVSMWTSPNHRRHGVGRLLVNEVFAWARQRGTCEMYLMVTSHNVPAIRFYEQLGFTRTGRTEPYPNDPALVECEMSLSII
jgi:ribosomal protein S18 acetylase RimI-like enzyme